MIEKSDAQNCAIFQAQLPELINSGDTIADHLHLQQCANCRALLADLRSIAEAACQLFPIQDPPDALWDEIQFAIVGDNIHTRPL